MVSAEQHAMLPGHCKLLSQQDAPVAQDAPVHVKLDVWSEICHRKFPLFFFEPGLLHPKNITKILQVAFSGLVTYGTIEGMVDQKELHDRFPGFHHFQ
jgi:hypothetical protein